MLAINAIRPRGALLRIAAEQGVSPELLTPFMALMERRVAEGGGNESNTGIVDLLRR
ncbi:hypothetical protein [Nocardia sp. NBC_00403]|uniref:hypothetical protein n=1 Tax=Nocardia sp. NBC_00403 TaxID=2975990 RepID=UPI002E20E043